MNHRLAVTLAGALSLALAGCSTSEPPAKADATAPTSEAANPMFTASSLPFGYPPFDQIRDEHFAPAFEKGMAEHAAEIEVIANNAEPASFDNTIVAMERSGQLLDRVQTIFFSLAGANTNDALEQIQTEMAPKLSAHQDAIALNSKLFERVRSLYEQRDTLGLDAESNYLLERYHTDFVRAGAKLSDADKEKLKAINSELASLQTLFSQNVLKETNASAIVVDTRDELAGLSDNAISAAAQAAKAAGKEGKFVLAMMNTSGQPALAALENRALRERIQTTSVGRGSHGGEFDNRATIARVAKLRAERAQLMGYANHAAYSLEDQTARTTDAVNTMLSDLAPAAVANAGKEAADMQKLIDAENGGFKLAAWDWAYYAEKVRKARYDFDESQLRPYLELDNVLQNGVFFAANQLYGLSFKERTDLPVYQPDVRVFDVFDADGSQLAIFIADYYARPSKRGGAWMNAYVSQSGLMGTHPVVANHLNIPKPPAGEPTLLTFDEANTMFHEFGHALHGMFSNVRYPRFSGTSVPRDFVEYPSQVNEMWMTWPEVLANYAKHYQTGEPMPQVLLDKVMATQKFNQGFATTEYLAASLLDQAWHQMPPEQVPDTDGVLAFEANALKQAGVDFAPVPPRYRSTYFSHIIGGYAAGYYSYIWSEVLDADSVEWFKENGGLKRANGDHFRNTLLSRGGAEDAMTLFANFRGRAPDTKPLLVRRGLDGGKQ
ncbi:MAG: dipeptidyl carboxypeptidase II [Lysobacterales bacterium CG17_big_fil_post_rev_8_21_14_2_50_64_11]|nr:MAG: dipeptidyl carboxypeptidase II [Xanthomonadales bacterium CG17_big_fil_post_rev_8_21_14_2_50_64_11]PIX59731.1 MAG: dipeptidyl carboxypeptidase II [Xanthomonadales bacterium CG_4_10_14_3_um_filter_64_11]